MSSEERPQRKRLRVPISCETCRKKKIRCDKGRPSCKSCIKSKTACLYQEMKFDGSGKQLNNILNLGSFVPRQSDVSHGKGQTIKMEGPSTYTFDVDKDQGKVPLTLTPPNPVKLEQVSENDTAIKEELAALKSKIKLLESSLHDKSKFLVGERGSSMTQTYSENETINFYDGYSPLQISESRVFNHGPLSWVTLVKKDIYVRCLWIQVLSTNRSSLILHSTVKNVEDDVRDADDTLPNELDAENKEKQYNRKSIGFTTNYRPDTEFGTIQLILRILPHKKYIWALIDRFFEVVYPFMPYLDYDNFIRQIVKIIGERSTENVKIIQLGIDKRLDFALVGILLLILRFGFLSLQSNCDSQQKMNLEMSGLADQDISVDFPTAAQYCLNQFRILRSSNLEILQCSLFMRIYHRYSPEDGDGADADSQIYNGMLFQMAISIGLNRDPEELLKPSVNPKLCQLRRKIWYAILQLETYHSLVLGSPSYTKVQSSNIKLPELNSLEFNSPTEETERFVIFWIKKYSIVRPFLSRINELVLNLKGDTKISDVVSCLKETEEVTDNSFHSLDYVLKLPANTLSSSLHKVRSIQSYLESISTMLCVYFHLFIHYDISRENQTALYYLRKITHQSTELFCGFTKVVNKLHKYVGYGFDFYLTHTLLITMHRAIQGQFSLFVRLCHCSLLLMIQGDPLMIGASIIKMKNVITKTLASYLKELKKLTPKYYYAWKMFKAQNAIYQIMTSDQIFKIQDNKVVTNQTKIVVGDIPQYSILSTLSAEELQSIYPLDNEDNFIPTSYQKTSFSAHTPTALSHILNATPSTTSPSVSLSPDHIHQDLMTNSTSKEVDDLWLSLLNKKKENDIDESITYANRLAQMQMIPDADQQRQFQQPDFSSLLEMNSLFPKPAQAQFDVANTTTPGTANRSSSRFGAPSSKNAASSQLPQASQLSDQSQPQSQPQPQTQPQPHQSSSQAFQYDALSLNGLLEGQLNFNQLFGTPESPFNNFL